MLIEKDANIDTANNDGKTPLHLARSGCGRLEAVKSLHENDADADAEDRFGQTSLHRACDCNDCDLDLIIKFLVESCADNPNARDIYGTTPLHLACTHHNLEAIKLLVKYGADPSLKVKATTSSR